jgi:peptidyl-prolyl cis-trans isomerase SurA
MGNKKHLSLWSVGLLLFGCLAVVAYAETLERIVAVVNGDIILYGDILEQINSVEKGKPSVNLQDPEVKAKVEREVLQTLIRQRLADQEVKRQKIVAAKSEVDKTIEDIRRENGGLTQEQFELLLARDGMDLKKFREKLRQDMERKKLMERVVKSKIVITESQIDARLQSQPVQPDRPLPMPGAASSPTSSNAKGKRHLAMIFLPVAEGDRGDAMVKTEKQAHKIHDQLKGREDFAKLAKDHSHGPGAADGGDIGFVGADELAPEIEKGIRGLSEGDVSEVVKTSKGFYILKILGASKEPAPSPQQQSPSHEPGNVREVVRRQLFMEELSRKYEEWIQDVEKKAFIKITL